MKIWRWLFLLVVLAAGGAAAWRWWTGAWPFLPEEQTQVGGQRQGARAQARGGRRGRASDTAVPVLAVAAARRDVPVYRDGIGNVQAYAAITVRAQIDGKLLSVEFREGQEVKKGDVLARIDPGVYQAQLDQALAKKAQDEATLANARIDLDRYEKLAATNAGSKQQADSQRAMVAQMEALVRADQAAIDNARTVLGYTTVTSPIDGRAGLRQIDAGNIIRASDANGLVAVMQVKPIAVVFTLPQRDFQAVSAALAAGPVPAQAMDSDGRTPVADGTLEVIDNQIDTTTGTFKLKAVFPNENQRLWPGQFVTARLRVRLLRNVLVVPTPALRRGPDGTFVYVVGEDDKAAVRKVVSPLQDEDRAVITEGLQEGEQVVTSGFARLADGKEVSVSQPPAPAAVPAAAPQAEGAPAQPAGAQPRAERPTRGEGGERRRRDGQQGPRGNGGGQGRRGGDQGGQAGQGNAAPSPAPSPAPAPGGG